MTSTDFAAPGDVYDPVAPDVFFSLPPLLLAGVVLALLAFLLMGWFGREAWGPKPADPCDGIWKAINEAAQAAVKSPRNQVVDHAGKLTAIIKKRLGGVIALSNGLSDPYRDIGLLTEGKRPGGGHGAGHDDVHETPTRPEGIFINSGTGKLVVHNNTAGDGGHADPHDDHSGSGHDDHADGGHHAPPPLAAKDQIDLLRAELHRFADHWADKSERVAELRAARANLC